MRNFLMSFSLVALLVFTVSGTGAAYAQDAPVNSGKAPTQLTTTQKKELAGLHKEILQKKKTLISKYVEYGVLPQKKGDKIIAHMDRHYAKMEKNGFVPKWHKHMKRHCKHSKQSR